MLEVALKETTFGARLKALFIAVVVTAAVTLALVPSAKANDRCEDYAHISVEQQAMNLTQGCGFKGFRWHGWSDGHYQWCKTAKAQRVAREIRRRDDELHHCHDDF